MPLLLRGQIYIRVSNAELKRVVLAVLHHILPPANDIVIGDYPGLP